MKQIRIFLVLIALYTVPSAIAQKVYIEPGLGYNIIPMEKSDIGRSYRLGVHTGIGIEYHLSNHFSLHTGLFYTQKEKNYHAYDTTGLLDMFTGVFGLMGVDETYIDSLIGFAGVDQNIYKKTDGIVTMNFLELPVLATYKIGNMSFYCGPYVSILLGTRSKEVLYTHTPLLQAFDITQLDTTGMLQLFLPPAESKEFKESSEANNLRGFDFGATVGLGYGFKDLNFNALFSYGFPDYRIDRNGDAKNTHKSFRFTIAYRFGAKIPKKNKPSMFQPGA